MAAKIDPAVLAHLEWLGFVQPVGLVVSAPALVRAGAVLERRDAEGQERLRRCVAEYTFDKKVGPVPYLPDFRVFAESVLGWKFSSKHFVGTEEAPIPEELELHEYDELLRPTFAVREPEPKEGGPAWQLLVCTVSPGTDIDQAYRGKGSLEASAHSRLIRLLLKTGVTAGLLFNGQTLRLISAPRRESSGWVDFDVASMVQTAGRPIFTAMHLLLNQRRLLSLPRTQRLTALLEDSRKFQNEVSERLAEQVLHALYELLRGFQAAHDASKQTLLNQALRESPNEVYRGLLTVILRLVFLLYAEERDMLPKDETFVRYYSLAGLYERLREDAAFFPDTMEQRYGAWAQLLVLFRMVYDGAQAGTLHLPQRHGVLFEPDRFKFLEGRPEGGARQIDERLEIPLVPDGTIYRALEKLLVLDGERLSYRALDVEQIGSVYQTMMGFRLETATGRSVAIRADKKQGASTTIDLDALQETPPAKRGEWLEKNAARKIGDKVKKAVVAAQSIEDLHAALGAVIDRHATPDLVPPGALVLQPSEERRRSGSHYTPRSLTKPIVETTLEPVLARLREEAGGKPPRPEALLDLKVCDPAMGSAAFLVEACRQLGGALKESWAFYGEIPQIPLDEDIDIFAMRLIAQRCIYGVDRNPVAVDLAKVSLWLATLAREHAFTFLDHALRHGDALVGLSREQIIDFHWEVGKGFTTLTRDIPQQVQAAATIRQQIREAKEESSKKSAGEYYSELNQLLRDADAKLSNVRLYGDLVLAAFFSANTPREREAKLKAYASAVADGTTDQYRNLLETWRNDEKPLVPFHWPIEFPEVFDRTNPGFDTFIGNPPYAGKNTMAAGNATAYPIWLQQVHEESHGNADLAAHFFRRAFNLNRQGGTTGFVSTNTIAQGDTRSTGLRWICTHGGEIYNARKRMKWPGLAAVVVSVVYILKGQFQGIHILDENAANTITAFLFHRGEHEDPKKLKSNSGISFQGSIVLGMGFTFDDTDTRKIASPIQKMHDLINADVKNSKVIFPYIGGEEINNHPEHKSHRFVINFSDMDEDYCRRNWNEVLKIVEDKVKPVRANDKRESYRKYWWQHAEKRNDMYAKIQNSKRVLVTNCGATPHLSIVFQPSNKVFANTLAVISYETDNAFCILQSRVHECWARFLSSSMKDDLRYTPSDCFETFPFPKNGVNNFTLEEAGRTYYIFRAALMIRNNQGLTDTYNRFHDPYETDPDILKLRELHTEMDRAVLHAYGWDDIPTDCEFLLDYEDDEDEPSNKRKKPWRYRWPDDVRDDVLARLLELNAQYAKEEALAGATTAKKTGGKGRPKKNADTKTISLF